MFQLRRRSNRTSRRASLALVWIIIVAGGCGRRDSARAPGVQAPGAQLRVSDAADLREAPLDVIHLIGSDTDPDYQFARIDGIETYPDSSVLVLDRVARTIRRFSYPDYAVVRSSPIVRGEGPGEFNDIYSMSLSPSGQLAVAFQYGVALLDDEFNETSRFRVSSNTPGVEFANDSTLIVVSSPRTLGGDC